MIFNMRLGRFRGVVHCMFVVTADQVHMMCCQSVLDVSDYTRCGKSGGIFGPNCLRRTGHKFCIAGYRRARTGIRCICDQWILVSDLPTER